MGRRRRFIRGDNRYLVPQTVTKVFESSHNATLSFQATAGTSTNIYTIYCDDPNNPLGLGGFTGQPWGLELFLSALGSHGMYTMYRVLKLEWWFFVERHTLTTTHNSLLGMQLDEAIAPYTTGVNTSDWIDNPHIMTKVVGNGGNNGNPKATMSGKVNVQKFKRHRVISDSVTSDNPGDGWVQYPNTPTGPRPVVTIFNTPLPNYGGSASSGRISLRLKWLIQFTDPNYTPT